MFAESRFDMAWMVVLRRVFSFVAATLPLGASFSTSATSEQSPSTFINSEKYLKRQILYYFCREQQRDV